MSEEVISAFRAQLDMYTEDEETVVRNLLHSKLNHLHNNIHNLPSNVLFSQIEVFAEKKIELFRAEENHKLLLSFLRTSKFPTAKKQPSKEPILTKVTTLCASILYSLYKNEESWPIEFLELYLDDALGTRLWVETSDASLFSQNLVEWASHCSKIHFFTKVTNQTTLDEIEDGEEVDKDSDSSGDEEILEEGTGGSLSSAKVSAPGPKVSPLGTPRKRRKAEEKEMGDSRIKRALPDVMNRFTQKFSEAMDKVIRTVNSRLGNVIDLGVLPAAANSAMTGANSWSAIATISTFCKIPRIREIASLYLEKWLNNPALTEPVKALVQRLSDCLENETLTHGPTSLDRSLIVSDMGVVQEIVKLRSKLKASQVEVYNGILAAVIQRGTAVCVLVFRLLIIEDLIASALKPETVKLLISLIISVSKTIDKTSLNNSGYSFSKSIQLLGLALSEIISQLENKFQSSHNKMLIDLLLRILRGLELRKVDSPAFLEALLGNAKAAARSSYNDSTGTFQAHLLHSEVFRFFADVAVVFQLLNANEIVAIRKIGATLGTGAGTSTVSGGMSSSVSANTSVAHSAGMAGGRGMAAGRLGGMGRAGSAGAVKGRLGTARVGALGAIHRMPSGAVAPVLHAAPLSQVFKEAAEGGNGNCAVEGRGSSAGSIPQAALGIGRVGTERTYMTTTLHIQETMATWLYDILMELNVGRRTLSSSLQDRQEAVLLTDAVDWLQRVTGLHPSAAARFGAIELDKLAHFYLRDHAPLSSKLLSALVSIIRLSSREPTHLHMGLEFVEALVTRALRRGIDSCSSSSATSTTQNSSALSTPSFDDYVLLDDPTIVAKLFGLSKLEFISKETAGRGNFIPSLEDSFVITMLAKKSTTLSSSMNLSGLNPDLAHMEKVVGSSLAADSEPEDALGGTRGGADAREQAYDRTHKEQAHDRTHKEQAHDRTHKDMHVMTTADSQPENRPRSDSLAMSETSQFELYNSLSPASKDLRQFQDIGNFFNADGDLTMLTADLPSLGLQSVYWRVCTLCFILSCARPDTIGNFVWENVPTVRALMLMAISDRQNFVPLSDVIDSSVFDESNWPDAPRPVRTRRYIQDDVELHISTAGVRAVRGRASNLEGALKRLEKETWEFFFAEPASSFMSSSNIGSADPDNGSQRSNGLSRESRAAARRAFQEQQQAELEAERCGFT